MKTDNTELNSVFTSYDNVPETLVEALLNAKECVSDDATRYALNEPIIKRVADSAVEVVATNGHILSRRTIQIGELAKEFKTDKAYRLRDETTPILKLMLKATRKTSSAYQAEVSPKSITLSSVLAKGLSVTLEPCDSYPEYNQLTPTIDEENLVTLAFNPDYLTMLFDAMKSDKRQVGIKLQFDKSKFLSGKYLNPMPVIVGDDGLGLLMPIRL